MQQNTNTFLKKWSIQLGIYKLNKPRDKTYLLVVYCKISCFFKKELNLQVSILVWILKYINRNITDLFMLSNANHD